MKKTMALAGIIFAALATTSLSNAGRPAMETNAKDRKDLMVTVYNDNRALVREVRTVQLPTGRVELSFADVADKIIPPSVHIVSRSDARSVDVIEQNYRFDVLSPSRLMERAVGTDITFVRENPATGAETRTKATLLAHESGDVFRVGTEIVIGSMGRPVFTSLPPSFVSHPTLVWTLENRGPARAHDLEVAYLTNQMNWKADYVALLSADDTNCAINGWVTLQNESGAAFDSARLSLVAGNVHQARGGEEDVDEEQTGRGPAGGKDSGGAFSEESLLDYHLYSLGRVTDIKDKEQKQIALLSAQQVPVVKILRLIASPSLRGSPDSLQENLHPKVLIEIVNSAQAHLGMALPMGTVRVYKADKSGGQQFIGEDSIQHTPNGEKLSLELGESFDVVAERKSVDFKALSRDLTEATYEVKVKNHKDQAAVVQLDERLSGEWEILEATPTKGEKLDARRMRFTLTVPAKGEITLRYKVRARFS